MDDEALLAALREMITPDKLESLSMKTVMRALREQFGEEVRLRKPWVSEQVTAIVQGLGEQGAEAAASESEASDVDLSDGETAAKLTDAELAVQMQAEFNSEGLRTRRAAAPKRKRPAADESKSAPPATSLCALPAILSPTRQRPSTERSTSLFLCRCMAHLMHREFWMTRRWGQRLEDEAADGLRSAHACDGAVADVPAPDGRDGHGGHHMPAKRCAEALDRDYEGGGVDQPEGRARVSFERGATGRLQAQEADVFPLLHKS